MSCHLPRRDSTGTTLSSVGAFASIGSGPGSRVDICPSRASRASRALPSFSCSVIGGPFVPPTSVTWVSFQPARVFSQKMAAMTASRPSRCLAVEVLGDLGVGLDVAVVELAAIVLPERLRGYSDHAGDIGFGDAVAGHGFHLAADAGSGL